MLHEFLTSHRGELIDRCRTKVLLRFSPKVTRDELLFGIPQFLDQLIETLRVEQGSHPAESLEVSGPAGGNPARSEIGEMAAKHGVEMLRRGFSVDQVVHDYGDLCQAVTELSFERNAPIDSDEFRTLNRCLDNAIADAVMEYVYQRELQVADTQVAALNERLGFFAHELRNHVNTAMLALSVVKGGKVGIEGATGAILDCSLMGLRTLIDRSLTEVRIMAGMPAQNRVFSLAEFIADIAMSAALEARARECVFTVTSIDPQLALHADRDLLSSAVGNLLQNAFKFTHRHTEVTLNAYAAGDRILIDVKDNCGGLATGDAEKLFVPFSQNNIDKTGLGLGLSIARRSVEAIDGTLGVRDVPGSGCIFTIDLPRHSMPAPQAAAVTETIQ